MQNGVLSLFGCAIIPILPPQLLRLDDEQSQNHLAMVASGKTAPTAPYILPDGWIVEEVPRRYDNMKDKVMPYV